MFTILVVTQRHVVGKRGFLPTFFFLLMLVINLRNVLPTIWIILILWLSLCASIREEHFVLQSYPRSTELLNQEISNV